MRMSILRTGAAMLARELHVLRRNLLQFAVNTGMQPLLAVFVFTYVLPKIGVMRGAQGFGTILVPGLVASTTVLTAIAVVSTSLMRELSFGRAIEDRMLAPLPVWGLGVQKIVWGALHAFLAGLVVFLVVYFVHEPGMRPSVHVANWPLLVSCLVFIPLMAASVGLLVGTILEPSQVSVFINLAMIPATMLGCVYFPWAALRAIPWLQVGVLINPVVYASEALRAVFTPDLPHMPVAVVLSVLVAATAGVGWLAIRSFQRRLLG
ncbi:MAG: ABC transporter permease [Micromonosporaceae bacterium]|nr:ABC transporter permease [Micromonosporaceae bacterium]